MSPLPDPAIFTELPRRSPAGGGARAVAPRPRSRAKLLATLAALGWAWAGVSGTARAANFLIALERDRITVAEDSYGDPLKPRFDYKEGRSSQIAYDAPQFFGFCGINGTNSLSLIEEVQRAFVKSPRYLPHHALIAAVAERICLALSLHAQELYQKEPQMRKELGTPGHLLSTLVIFGIEEGKPFVSETQFRIHQSPIYAGVSPDVEAVFIPDVAPPVGNEVTWHSIPAGVIDVTGLDPAPSSTGTVAAYMEKHFDGLLRTAEALKLPLRGPVRVIEADTKGARWLSRAEAAKNVVVPYWESAAPPAPKGK